MKVMHSNPIRKLACRLKSAVCGVPRRPVPGGSVQAQANKSTRYDFTGRCLVWQVLLVLLCLGVWYMPATAQESDTSGPTRKLNTEIGVVDGFINTDEATAAGAGWTRVFFRWDVIQPGGPSDWKPANVPDPLLNGELEAGREIVGVIIGTPGWATESGSSTAVPPMEFWGDFVFKLATQYRGRVNRWVIWNQPDVDDPASPNFTWAGTDEDYFLLLKEAYLKIKAVDPEMQVHLAGLTYTWDQQRGNRQFLDRITEIILNDPDSEINGYYFDAVTFHHYYDPNQLFRMVQDGRRILAERGLAQKPIWINEINAPPSEDFIEPPLQPPVFRVSLEEQSYYLLQAVAMAKAAGAERIAFNKLRNQSDYMAAGVPYGLLRADNSRRPAFDAFRVGATYLVDAGQVSLQQLGSVFVVTFDRAGQTTTMIWNSDRASVTFPLTAISSQALLVTERGNIETIAAVNGRYSIELPGAPCTNGDYCFIGGPPRLIVESGSASQRPPLTLAAPAPVEDTAPPTVAPVSTSTATPTPPAPPPTVTPVQAEATPIAGVNTPVAAEPTAPPPASNGVETDGTTVEPAAPPAILPDSDSELVAPGTMDDGAINDSVLATPVPPVSVVSIFRPERVLWLFIIGVVVFTVTYGIQVAIWSQFRNKR
jgi:hypothetical protein